MKLYNVAYSGNSYKVRLLLGHLGISCETGRSRYSERTEPDAGVSENQSQRAHPRARRPRLHSRRIQRNSRLSGSRTRYLPDDRRQFGSVFQWMFFEQYSHEPYIATSRFWLQHKPDSPEKAALLASKCDGGRAALRIMEDHLSKNEFFVGGYSIADIALFAYTHVAHEGGFPLNQFPRIKEWIERVKAQPGFIPMS